MPNYPSLEKLGASLLAARKGRNLTQQQLSDRSSISIRHIAKIEKGQMNPSFEVLYALVNNLGISADTLFFQRSEEDNREKELMGVFKSLNEQDRQFVLDIVQFLSAQLLERQRAKDM